MLGFMDYVQRAWLEATAWDRDNSYSNLTATAQNLLDFETPRGLRLNVSSLASANIATSYALGSVGAVDGSLSYLYSSLPLQDVPSRSGAVDLRNVIRGYRQLQQLRAPDEPWWWEVWHRGRRVDTRDTLLYGRLYLPTSTLEALYQRRLTPTRLLSLSCVSSSRLKNGGTLLVHHTQDTGLYSLETLLDTDSLLLGFRGLYNIALPTTQKAAATTSSPEPTTRLSAGAELYYGVLNSTIGISTGLRLTTLPSYPAFPLTLTLTANPLMGSTSCTYAVRATEDLALATRFDFNAYSYESAFVLGCELWRRRPQQPPSDLAWAHRRLGTTPPPAQQADERAGEDVQGVLKSRIDHRGAVGLLWEGRVKDLLFSLGATFDLRRRDQPFRSLGLELHKRGTIGLPRAGRVKDLLLSLGAISDLRRRDKPFRSLGLEPQYPA
ncbi:MAG: Mitochondrial distribution and morphology protein 10 [Thelocarpon impressellum]|nr:MAG: Mitochondrial distribution and morphology protein 10 [Thelocarpon impressellum]